MSTAEVYIIDGSSYQCGNCGHIMYNEPAVCENCGSVVVSIVDEGNPDDECIGCLEWIGGDSYALDY